MAISTQDFVVLLGSLDVQLRLFIHSKSEVVEAFCIKGVPVPMVSIEDSNFHVWIS